MDHASLAVTATFTADPLHDSLAFWMKELGRDLRPVFAPYNQVFQQLLDPQSALGQGRGVGVVLVRPDDWLRYAEADGGEHDRVLRNVDELAAALAAAADRSPAPLLCLLCPPAPGAIAIDGLEPRLRAAVADRRNVHVLAHADLEALYPVREIHDPHGDAIGHIPYTATYFAALGTFVARTVHALRSPPRKVIAVDCDDTLWKGVVGEVGAMGVEIDPPRRALQELLVAQKESGMLLCVVSKNDADDALDVWKHRPEMPLKRDDIVGARVNWRPKSENLRSLADELRLGLDSFVFLDDNPIERAEVAARCPEVLVLDLPPDFAEIPAFLRHVWAFDHLRVTEEDRRRTALYQENAAREQLRREAPTLADFLGGLGLEVTIREPAPAQIARTAQLTQRTNQFNTTTLRRTEAEIDALVRAGAVRIVEVRDRFGDYGIVGVMIARPEDGALRVDALLLSCRVLGRGVENRMLRALGEIAEKSGLASVDLRFVPSRKNQPARDFLDAAGAAYREPVEGGFIYRFPTAVATSLSLLPFVAEMPADEGAASPSASAAAAPSAVISRIARELRDVDAILAAIAAERRRHAPEPPAASASTERTPVEETITGIWTEVLGIEPIALDQDFIDDLGGDSLAAAQVVSRLRRAFHAEISIELLFEAKTISALAVKVVEQLADHADHDVADLLAELEGA